MLDDVLKVEGYSLGMDVIVSVADDSGRKGTRAPFIDFGRHPL